MVYRLEVNELPSEVTVGEQFSVDAEAVCWDNKDTVKIGNDSYGEDITLTLVDVSIGQAETVIDIKVESEQTGSEGRFGTGLDINVFGGTRKIEGDGGDSGEWISFRADNADAFTNSNSVSISQGTNQFTATITVPSAVPAPCVKIGSVEGTERDGDEPQRVCWQPSGDVSCRETDFSVRTKKNIGFSNLWNFPVISNLTSQTVVENPIQFNQPKRQSITTDIILTAPGEHTIIMEIGNDIRETRTINVLPVET